MKRKEYIDWLNEMIGIKEREIELLQIFINEGKTGNQSKQDLLKVELSIFRICLNRFKGR